MREIRTSGLMSGEGKRGDWPTLKPPRPSSTLQVPWVEVKKMDTPAIWSATPVIKDVLLALLAIYGAILSTFNWRQASRKERRVVKVCASTAVPTYGDSLGKALAKIEATNVGQRTVTVKTLAFELPNRSRMYPRGSNTVHGINDTLLPTTLSDGQSAQIYMSYDDIGRALIQSGNTQKLKLTPVCDDSTGVTYRGEPWDVDPQEFLKL